MSKLDDIYEESKNWHELVGMPKRTKQQIKDLMLELIGEDQIPSNNHPMAYQQSFLKAELRQKVNEL